MSINIISDILIPCSGIIIGGIFGFLFKTCWEGRLYKAKKYDEIILANELIILKEKLDIYWSIYFKLVICLSTKLHIKKINNTTTEISKMIQMENDIIIKNLEEIITIISNNTQIMDIDDNLLELILRFISHVLSYKCLLQLNIVNKIPSDYGFPYPDEFTKEITRRTILIQSKYEEYIGHKYNSQNLKGISFLTMSLNNIDSSINNYEFQQKLKKIHSNTISIEKNNTDIFQSDSDTIDDDFVINPNDINLTDIFIGVYQNNELSKQPNSLDLLNSQKIEINK